VVDGGLTKLPSMLVKLGSRGLARLQTGRVQAYGLAMVAGFAFVVTWATTPHIDAEVEVLDGRVRFDAAPGPGYSYRWTMGEGESEQVYDARSVVHAFSPEQYEDFVLLVTRNINRFLPGEEEIELDAHPRVLGSSELGDGWRREEGEMDPAIFVRDGAVILRPNGVTVAPAGPADRGAGLQGEEIELDVGRRVRLGTAIVRVAPRVHASLEIHNVFGNAARESFELTLGEGGRAIGGARAALDHSGVHR